MEELVSTFSTSAKTLTCETLDATTGEWLRLVFRLEKWKL